MRRVSFLVVLLVGLVGCGSSGVGPGVRKDVNARMKSVEKPVAACYADAIERKGPRTRGMLLLSYEVAPKSGKFRKVEVVRDDIGDAALEKCLVAKVSKLKLKKPQDVKLAVTYPVNFEPEK